METLDPGQAVVISESQCVSTRQEEATGPVMQGSSLGCHDERHLVDSDPTWILSTVASAVAAFFEHLLRARPGGWL